MDIEIYTFVNATYGRLYPAERWFEWSTDVVSKGRTSQRNQLWSQPRRHWLIHYDVLTLADRNKLLELFSRAAGMYRTFKLRETGIDADIECDLADCSITAVADQTQFQLIKTYYTGETEEWDEDKTLIAPAEIFIPTIKVDSVTKTEGVDFTLDDDTGIVTFGAAPGAGKVITANYQFYFKVRFNFDLYQDIRNLPDYWQYHGVELLEDES